VRYNYYDDNTPATTNADGNFVDEIFIPSLLVQDEYKVSEKHSLLGGLRYDYDSRHGNIFTPRAAYRWKITDTDILRVNTGTGFRVVNLFTEDHAALTGSREVVIEETLEPEQSFNINLNYLKKIYADNGTFIGLDASVFYTNFSNQIIPDYDTNVNQIIYDNLDGASISQGVSANLDLVFPNGLKLLLGATYQDVTNTENEVKQRQILTESFTGTWNVSYTFRNLDLTVDYTGNLYGPMRLPILGELDPRSEFYSGIKNLLDWTPNRGNPFIIARTNDPFDRNVQFDNQGNVLATPDNPNALTFDANYVYGPNQGIRGFFGLRYTVF
jgi:outer membrane receptor for ferrienterochelin and colicins